MSGEDRLINRIMQKIGEVCEVRITPAALEALRLDLCGGNEEMLRSAPRINDGANVWGFTVRIDDSITTPEGFKVVVLTYASPAPPRTPAGQPHG